MPIWLSWSSGKDSAYAYEVLRKDPQFRVVALLTTLSSSFERVSIHGVREELLERQAAALELPLVKVFLPYPCPNERYEHEMRSVLARAQEKGVRHVAFGDLFLEDVRRYREARLGEVGMQAVFPLWGERTDTLARRLIAAGIEAWVCCLDPRKLSSELAGARFDTRFLDRLPSGVDPCGERGEFHTFVANAPSFRTPVSVRAGATVVRDGFVFADLVPA